MNRHNRLSLKNTISKRIYLCFIFLILLFTVSIFINQIIISQYIKTDEKNRLYSQRIVVIKQGIVEANSALESYLSSGNTANLNAYNEAINNVSKDLEHLISDSDTAVTMSFVRSISDSFHSYQRESNYALGNYKKGDQFASSTYKKSSDFINGYIQQYCNDLMIERAMDNKALIARVESFQGILRIANALIILVLFVLIIYSMVFLRKNIDAPLNELHAGAIRIGQGERNVIINEKWHAGTMEILSRAFNTMSKNIDEMIESLEGKAEIEKNLMNEKLMNVQIRNRLEIAKYSALQAQTNPHFLFNTLNSISRTISLGRDDAAITMIDAMTKLLRYRLLAGDEMVLLADELNIMKQYLKIQQYRFQERITYTVNADKTLINDVLVPRLTIQPIIENAVIHGIEPKPQGGNISITVGMEGDFCAISIVDNGIGIPPDILTELMDVDDDELDEKKHESIGLRNTRKRLKRVSQHEKVMDIKSIVGEGTEVKIYLNMKGYTNV